MLNITILIKYVYNTACKIPSDLTVIMQILFLQRQQKPAIIVLLYRKPSSLRTRPLKETVCKNKYCPTPTDHKLFFRVLFGPYQTGLYPIKFHYRPGYL